MNSKLTGEGAGAAEVKKKLIAIFAYKQRLLSTRDENKSCSACRKDQHKH